MADHARSLPVHLLPHHLLSRAVLAATRVRRRWWKELLIRGFVRWFGIDLGEAAEPDPEAYGCFNDFFTRALRPGVRPLAEGLDAVTSPNDGWVSEIGSIDGDRVLQAKGRYYSVSELLGGGDGEQAPGDVDGLDQGAAVRHVDAVIVPRRQVEGGEAAAAEKGDPLVAPAEELAH